MSNKRFRLWFATLTQSNLIRCAWIDEFNTRIETVTEHDAGKSRTAYRKFHSHFADKRIKKLKDQPVRRKAEIVDCAELYPDSPNDYDSIKHAYFEKIKLAIVEKHLKHNTKDTRSDRLISFGVVRMANIEPCIKLAEYLMQAKWPDNFGPKIMSYHSRQVLLLRNEQEKHLDEVLRRKEKDDEEAAAFKNQAIRQHIDSSNANHIIFVLVATPVEEVGRDHDFDWAVIEPSSFRSIIQLAGRVLRHRLESPQCANIAVMQYNLKALKLGSDKPAYCRPGYEDHDGFRLTTHDLKKLLDEKSIARCIDATPRIKRNEPLCVHENLADLEHHVIARLLTSYDNVGPESMQGWLTQHWWLTAIPQQINQFRKSEPMVKLYLLYDDGELTFVEKDDKGKPNKVETLYGIEHDNFDGKTTNRLWLQRDYVSLLENMVESKEDISMKTASLKYGEINFPDYENLRANYIYSDRFGLKKEINK